MKIGDHDFVGGLCVKCGRHWVDVRHVDATLVGQGGNSSSGSLTAAEAQEYVADREREDAAIARAFAGIGLRR